MNQPLKLNLQSTMKDVDVLMGMLFTQKQDSAFTVFDNLTDAQILATLKNKNIGLNKTSTALVLVVNYDGTLYKKTIVDTVTTTPTPDYTAGVAKDATQSHTADSNGLVGITSNMGASGYSNLYINSVLVISLGLGSPGQVQISGNASVKKGDTYICDTNSTTSCVFYPII